MVHELLEQPQLKALLARCPELQAASDHVRSFATMLTKLTGQGLPQWISDVRDSGLPGLSSFAKGLEQDLDAVTQGLTTRWNSGPVEGPSTTSKRSKGRCSNEPGCRYSASGSCSPPRRHDQLEGSRIPSQNVGQVPDPKDGPH
jgi:hypothetical protein